MPHSKQYILINIIAVVATDHILNTIIGAVNKKENYPVLMELKLSWINPFWFMYERHLFKF